MGNRPFIKDTNRAYVRLYERIVKSGHDWESFKSTYVIRMPEYGMRRNGDCAVEVRDASGSLADLGPDIPHRITYNDFIEPPRTTWTEFGMARGVPWEWRKTT